MYTSGIETDEMALMTMLEVFVVPIEIPFVDVPHLAYGVWM